MQICESLPYRWLLVLATLQIAVGCNYLPKRGENGERTTTTSASAALSATVATTPSAGGSANPHDMTIACGSLTCRAGAEVCCRDTLKREFSCVPAPASLSEQALYEACGRKTNMVVNTCDDSGDCPNNTLCCQPLRHGQDASYGTQECVSEKECDGAVERCSQVGGNVCKRPEFVCGREGYCQKSGTK